MCSPSLCPTLLHMVQLHQQSLQMNLCPNTSPSHLSDQLLAFAMSWCLLLSPSNPPAWSKGKSQTPSDFPGICCSPVFTGKVMGQRNAVNESRTFIYQRRVEFSGAKEEFGDLCRTGQSQRFLLANQILKEISLSGAFYFQLLWSWSNQSEKNPSELKQIRP